MRGCSLILFFLLVVLGSARQACAYIDPGTGSMVVQALLAALAAVSVSIGLFWRRVTAFVRRLLRRQPGSDADAD